MKTYRSTLPLQNLRCISHPRPEASSDYRSLHPIGDFQRIEFAIAVANELFDFVRQFAGALAAVEGVFMSATGARTAPDYGPSESGAAKNQNAQRFHRFLCKTALSILRSVQPRRHSQREF